MSCHDMFRPADGSQIDADVPAEQEIEVGADLVELDRTEGRDCRFLVASLLGMTGACKEGGQEVGDAGGVHREIVFNLNR
jgi:hypothetical protein